MLFFSEITACNLTSPSESSVSNPHSFSRTLYDNPFFNVALNAQQSVFVLLVVKAMDEDVCPSSSPLRSML